MVGQGLSIMPALFRPLVAFSAAVAAHYPGHNAYGFGMAREFAIWAKVQGLIQ